MPKLRQANPNLKEQDALTAMDMGARRLDLIGMKFQLAQEIAESYAKALAQSARQSATARLVSNILSEIGGNNGRCQDLRDAYSALKAEYSQVWLGENRPYWLNNVTVRYDLEIEKWQRRGEHVPARSVRMAKWQGTCPRLRPSVCPCAEQQPGPGPLVYRGPSACNESMIKRSAAVIKMDTLTQNFRRNPSAAMHTKTC